MRFYAGPETVQGGMRFRLIDPLYDDLADGDQYQHQVHADQAALVLAVLPERRVLVETDDGARFTVDRKFLVDQ